MAGKPIYGPIPVRAFVHPDITRHALRTLGVIAAHDRLSSAKAGKGCYASVRRLADILGGDFSTVSESISWLRDNGFISVAVDLNDSRKRVFRVIYTAEDQAVIDRSNRWRPNQRSVASETNDKENEIVGLKPAGEGKIVGQAESQPPEIIGGPRLNIFPIEPQKDSIRISEEKDAENQIDVSRTPSGRAEQLSGRPVDRPWSNEEALKYLTEVKGWRGAPTLMQGQIDHLDVIYHSPDLANVLVNMAADLLSFTPGGTRRLSVAFAEALRENTKP